MSKNGQDERVIPQLCIYADCSDDEAVVAWLVREYQICLIPGSSCGAPGYIRVAFGNLHPEVCRTAAARLKAGLQRLVVEGPKSAPELAAV